MKEKTEKVIHPDDMSQNGKTIFLAGPISGAPNWQERASKLILAETKDLFIANPRRRMWPDPEYDFKKQTDWETKYLQQAACEGCILFWLAKQIEISPHDPSTGFPRIYSQTTRFELAEWKVHSENDPSIQMVIGIEEGFADADYIKRRFSQDCPDIPIFDSLEITCKEAVRIATSLR